MVISCYGRLVNDPRPIETRTGKPMTVARLVVNLPTRAADQEAGFFLGIVAFGAQADRLAALAKGAMCSVIGRGQLNRWQSDQGEREELQLVADEIVTAKSVRPAAGRKAANPKRQAEPEAVPFDDEIQF